MPKKSTKKGLCQKKQKQKGNKAAKEREKSDNDEHNYNKDTPDNSGKMAENMTSCPRRDFMVDISSHNTSVSGLTSSVTPRRYNETMLPTSAANIIVQPLEMLTSSEQQERAFAAAMGNPLFRNLAEKYNNSPFVTHPVMPAPTPSAERKRKSRNKKTAVDTIISSMSSLSTQEEKNEVMKVVLENSEADNAVLASGYIKKVSKI